MLCLASCLGTSILLKVSQNVFRSKGAKGRIIDRCEQQKVVCSVKDGSEIVESIIGQVI
jgi:hypothetical protein